MFDEGEAVARLESNVWSMFAQFGRVEPGRLIDTPTPLVLETDVSKARYNAHALYRRLGYRDVAMFELWARPDEVHL